MTLPNSRLLCKAPCSVTCGCKRGAPRSSPIVTGLLRGRRIVGWRVVGWWVCWRRISATTTAAAAAIAATTAAITLATAGCRVGGRGAATPKSTPAAAATSKT